MAGLSTSREKATLVMGSECPGITRMACPVATSHTTMVSSKLPLTRSTPVALKATHMAKWVWPRSVRSGAPVPAFQSLKV